MKRGLLILGAFIIGACASQQAGFTPTNLPTPAFQTISATAAEPEASPTFAINKHVIPTQYDLIVGFDYAGHTLQVQEEIIYFNISSDPIDNLELVVEAEHVGASFSIDNLAVTRGPNLGREKLSGRILNIPLESNLEPGESIQLEIDYTLVLPAGVGTLSWTDRQTNFVDWYPYIPPYVRGQGWLIHDPATVGEHEVFESANFRVHIEVVNAPASLQIAAPAPDKIDGAGFDYTLNNARRFAWSASGQYEMRNTESEGIPISIYYFGEHRDAAKASLQTAKEALAIYSNLFGPYPYQSLAIVDGQFFDGMESDGLFFLDQSYFLQYNYSPRNYLTALTAHEVAHSWWFGKVGNDQALEPWLDEAMCIYSELLYYENIYPEMTTWWWEFRIDRFHPEGWVDSSIYDHGSFNSYVQAVYMRGAQFLQSLRSRVGDSAFSRFLNSYASQETGKIVNRADFFDLLKRYSQSNIGPTLSEFFKSQ